ncbi:hypothetical protein [Rhodospirillum rubrum]|uniref:Uncharacterized protein n=2 Tax=Rhodospirillum rubrum TaxID=1085 RepID=Q2RPI9_RHORT|nr:hypothetical protein [Rhodospirillum rubrum]ABC23956.1 hypothetical protein Rru_A3161 [Rhodospirillum rubrum ATCC 11170]AEO49701.1 hypothetical protein F11_16195 [Rhodospirillum rubrum F11]MBK5955637.1 hypothetical protein [Rhodospirillum rubrum]QXG79899.1 hypothetical protein KUL73_16290 [Rhodospirillum rubrum]HAQ00983.1 hypothetical protein [Rhodospirillum rubrum]
MSGRRGWRKAAAAILACGLIGGGGQAARGDDGGALAFLPAPAALSLFDRPGFEGWRATVAAASWTGLSCARPVEMPAVVLCLFANSSMITGVLGRASVFAERSHGAVIDARLAEPFAARPPVAIRGADLPAATIAAFAAKAARLCAGDEPAACPKAEERAFYDAIVRPALAEDPQSVILAAGAGPGARATLSHELAHGRYFTDATTRAVVARYWREEMSENQRAMIRDILGRIYLAVDEALLINEFQAHVLQCPADSGMTPIAEIHRAPLTQALDAAGAPPLPACE